MYAHGCGIEANIPLDEDAFPQANNLRTCSG
jgi:hypothetical protein